LEAIFHTVDTIKSDLNKCGMRLQEARQFCGISPFTSTSSSFTCTYGIAGENLTRCLTSWLCRRGRLGTVL